MERNDSFLVNPVTGLGGPNDPAASTVINEYTEILAPTQLFNMYRGFGVAQRACTIKPQMATESGWVVNDPSPDPNPMKGEDQRLNIPARIFQAAVFSQIFGGGFILMIAEGELDAQGKPIDSWDPSLPLLPEDCRKIVNLIPMTTLECVPTEYESDATNSNFGRPKYWSCTPYPYMVNRPVITHHTRVLYFPGSLQPNRFRAQTRGSDLSILQAAWDQLKALSTTDVSVAAFVQRLNQSTVKMSSMNTSLASDQGAFMRMKMELISQMRSNYGVAYLDAEDEMDSLTNGVQGFADLSEHAQSAVSAALGYPRTVLFGDTPGGLNSDGDSHRALMAAQVHAFQRHCLLPPLTSLYRILYAQKEGPFKGKIPDYFEVSFNPIGRPSQEDEAVVRRSTAETDEIYIRCGVYTPEDVRRARFGPQGYSYNMPPLATAFPETGEVEEHFVLSEKQTQQFQALIAQVAKKEATPGQARTMAFLIAPKLPAKSVKGLFPDDAGEIANANTQPIAVQDTALTGQQMASCLEIMERVRTGQVTSKQASMLFRLAFPMVSPRVAKEMFADVQVMAKATEEPDENMNEDGLPIHLEYESGSIRSGIDEDGNEWSVLMPCGYGYIEGAPGLDGDEADILVAGEDTGTLYVIEHRFPDGEIDEYKCVMGVRSEGDAINLYNKVYATVANYGKVYTVPTGDILNWLERNTEIVSKIEQDSDEDTHNDAAPSRYKHINFHPPVAVAQEALRGLQWRAEHKRGGTLVGVARARSLSNRVEISPKTINRMVSYFARHQGDRRGRGYTPGPGFPSAGRIAWALWGGDAGKAWANKIRRQMLAADK